MKLLVIGGSRGVGRAVVLAAHGAGHSLTVMARHAAAFEPARGIRMVVGEAADAADLERATAGQEALIRDSALDWTIVQPLTLTRHGAAGGYQATTAPPGGPGKRIARADVAHYIVSHLADPEHLRQTVVLTGV